MRKTLVALLLAAPLAHPARKDEWAKGIPYTTDWKAAIRQARETGKMLFIYNGWERSGI
ncbi:MAG: hypothetical protein ACE5JG_08520 [Planctomycetota bacterium]